MAAPPAPLLSDLLRRSRRSLGLTQEKLAERAGVSARLISSIESESRHHPRKDTLQMLAEALELDPVEQQVWMAAVRAAQVDEGAVAPAHRQSSSLGSLVPTFQVHILWPFELVYDGRPLDTVNWHPDVRSLFLLVAASRGRRRFRDEIIDILWPDAGPETGPNNLRSTLHMLRRALGNLVPSPLLFEQGWISLNPAYHWEVNFY